MENERLAIVETKVDTVIELLRGHIDAPSCEKSALSEDVAVAKTNIKWMKLIGYSSQGLIGVALLVLGFLKYWG